MTEEPNLDGLSAAEAQRRHAEYGWNETAVARPSRLLALAKRFSGPSAWMIEVIVVLSLALGHAADAAIAAILLLLNAAIGYFHERRAEQAVEMLKQRLTITARVRRDGRWTVLEARELVPGDVVRLRLGDIVAADMAIAEGELEVDQSVLTGEAMAVAQKKGDTVRSGALVRQGEASCVVTAIGAATLYGRTIELVRTAAPKLHLDAIVGRLVRWLFIIVSVAIAIFLAVSLAGRADVTELLPLVLVMLMGAVPVALPVMFTVSTAYVARGLAKEGVLVTRLSASEDAASMTHLFLDKTGTVTMNRLAVMGVTEIAAPANEVLLYALAASDEANKDPIDEAVMAEATRRFGAPQAGFRRLSFTPFSPRSRRTAARIERDGATIDVTKGAVEAVIDWCGAENGAAALEEAARAAGSRGMRTIAVGVERDGARAIAGALSLADPPRADSKAMIEELHRLGVATKLLTGDAVPVASAVAGQVGLGRIDLLPAEDGELAAKIDELDGFAQVYPQDKHRVIRACQQRGLIVGMTGDGVNDAPALKQAEVGIAVSGATAVAKAAASVVLTREGLASIVDVVRSGRAVYERILTWMINKVSRTVLKTGFVLGGYLLTGHLVISASAMLLVSVGTDFAKIALATDHVRPSSRPDEWQVTRFAIIGAALGVLLTAEALAIFLAVSSRFALPLKADSQSLSFAVLLFLGLFSVLSMRERRFFLASRPSLPLGAALLGSAIAGALVAIFGMPGFPALGLPPVGAVCLGAGAGVLLINDPIKLYLFRRAGSPGT